MLACEGIPDLANGNLVVGLLRGDESGFRDRPTVAIEIEPDCITFRETGCGLVVSDASNLLDGDNERCCELRSRESIEVSFLELIGGVVEDRTNSTENILVDGLPIDDGSSRHLIEGEDQEYSNSFRRVSINSII